MIFFCMQNSIKISESINGILELKKFQKHLRKMGLHVVAYKEMWNAWLKNIMN
jgi:hypothetical protein